MMWFLLAYLAFSLVCAALVIAVAMAWKKDTPRPVPMDETSLEAALEGAMLRELSDHGFLRAAE